MKKAWIAILTVLLSAGFASPEAIGRGISFLKHSVNDGLSQSTVTAIVQDRQGNIWLGTQDGLNRYDGYGFEVFHGDPGCEGALGDSAISALELGSDGRLWIGTSSGLSCYDFRERRFRNHTIRNVSRVTDILETDGLLMLATDSGVYFFDPAHPEIPGDNLLAGINVRTLCFAAGSEEILVGSSSGLYNYEPKSRRIRQILPEMNGCDISAIVRTTDGYWISTHGNGLYHVDDALRQTAHYTQSNAPGLASDYIRVLKCDSNRRLWVGTYNGLSIFDERNGTFSRYVHTSDPSSISHDSVWSICIDNQQGVWLGTYYGGVNYYHPMADRFEILKPQDPAASGQRPVYGTVSCIVADPHAEVLWIGTNDDGIFRYDPVTGQFSCYNDHTVTASAGISNNIKCILPDDRGGLYVGTHVGGLNYLDVGTRRMENFPISNTSPINNGCYTLLDEGDGTLWVGTLSGLLSFDKQTRRFTRHAAAERAPRLASQHISTLFRDSKRRVWIGTDMGLYLCSEGCRDVRSLSDTKISGGGIFRLALRALRHRRQPGHGLGRHQAGAAPL